MCSRVPKFQTYPRKPDQVLYHSGIIIFLDLATLLLSRDGWIFTILFFPQLCFTLILTLFPSTSFHTLYVHLLQSFLVSKETKMKVLPSHSSKYIIILPLPLPQVSPFYLLDNLYRKPTSLFVQMLDKMMHSFILYWPSGTTEQYHNICS